VDITVFSLFSNFELVSEKERMPHSLKRMWKENEIVLSGPFLVSRTGDAG